MTEKPDFLDQPLTGKNEISATEALFKIEADELDKIADIIEREEGFGKKAKMEKLKRIKIISQIASAGME